MTINDKNIRLLEKAKTLTTKPGCYLFRAKSEDDKDILYVGKAKNLKNRVTSYFNNSAKSAKTQILVSHIHDFDFIITNSEAEAFVLENNLIKKHAPKYNIRLKDDKSYPYIEIDMSSSFPRPVYTRRPRKGKQRKLYGPFTTGSNISAVLRVLIKSFNLRDCTDSEFKRRKRPCMLFQMKQCSASCVEKISKEDYRKDLDFVVNFFSGKTKKTLKEIERRMFAASESEEYELAAVLRDNLDLLSEFANQNFDQNVEMSSEKDVDIFAYYVGEVEIDISIYLMRSGLLLGHKSYHFLKGDSDKENEEIFQTFIFQYYLNSNERLPSLIISNLKPKDLSIFQEAVHESLSKKTTIKKPYGKYQNLYDLTKAHAGESQRFRVKNQNSPWVGLNKLKELLGLKEAPSLLECYDVAIWQGKSPTASQIVFHEGKPDKKFYRYYHLEELPEGNNDFAMMKEVLTRRLKYGRLPDVFIVDGGKGQVGIFEGVLDDFGLNIPVVGIAKERVFKNQTFKDKEVSGSDERLIIPNRINPYVLKKCPSLLKICVGMRDEAHRFSRKLHHKAERKRIFKSWLDDIPGIGEKTKKKIREELDLPLSELKKYSVKQIMESLGISEDMAHKIKDKIN